MSLVLTCHVVFLGSDLHLGFVDILDYSCAVDRITDWSYRRSRTKQHQITSHHITWFLSGSHLKSPAANLASAKEKAASLITSPILVLVYGRETKEQSRPLDKHSVEILQQYMHWSEWSNPFFFNWLRWFCGGSGGSAWRERRISSSAGCGRSELLSAEPSWWSEPCEPKQNTLTLDASVYRISLLTEVKVTVLGRGGDIRAKTMSVTSCIGTEHT